jgi:hypothetical protein
MQPGIASELSHLAIGCNYRNVGLRRDRHALNRPLIVRRHDAAAANSSTVAQAFARNLYRKALSAESVAGPRHFRRSE